MIVLCFFVAAVVGVAATLIVGSEHAPHWAAIGFGITSGLVAYTATALAHLIDHDDDREPDR